MSEKVIVYTALAKAADQVVDALRREGFHPNRVEDRDEGEFRVDGLSEPYYRRGQWLDRVHIVVPWDEAESAKSFLRRWDEQCDKEVVKLTGGLARPLRISLAVAVVAAVATFACGVDIGNAALVFVGVWFVGFAVAANRGKARSLANRRGDDKTEAG